MSAQPIVVGYTATKRGRDAVAVAARLAAATGAALDVAVVLPAQGRSVITPPDASYDRHLHTLAQQWLAEAIARLPEGVAARPQIRSADSFAEGLIALADERGASHIVVGAGGGGLRGRHRLGTVAGELLHSADVPVVLAPEGARRLEPVLGVTRVTAAIGLREGADIVLDESVELASATGGALRLLSLAALDLPPGIAGIESAADHADDVFVYARSILPDGIEAEPVVALGRNIEDAVAQLRWQPGELAVVGSSRLARKRRLFLGATAAKMLRELPVPMIVVPRTRSKRSKKEAGE